MSINVWPFLVSRNRYLDYRTVVAPDFIHEAKIPNILARATKGDLTNPGQGIIRNILASKVGDFTIVFRVVVATEKDINSSKENNVLKDQFGREIYIFEGLVVQGIKEYFPISDKDFQKTHQLLAVSYKKFWNLVDPASPTSSQAFNFDVENIINPVELETLPLLNLTPKTLKSVSNSTSVADNIEFRKSYFKSRKNISRSRKSHRTLLLTLGSILIISFILILERALFGESIVLGCATTTEKKHLLVKEKGLEAEKGEIVEQLSELKKGYSDESNIYISGLLKIDPSRNLKNQEHENQDGNNKPTIKLLKEDNVLELSFHPISLAINDLENQKLSEDSEIKLRIINKSGCKENN